MSEANLAAWLTWALAGLGTLAAVAATVRALAGAATLRKLSADADQTVVARALAAVEAGFLATWSAGLGGALGALAVTSWQVARAEAAWGDGLWVVVLPAAVGLIGFALVGAGGEARRRWSGGEKGVEQAARALAVAGKYLQQVAEPFGAAVGELSQAVGKLDTEAAGQRMTAGAEAFAERVEEGAAKLAEVAAVLAPEADEVRAAAAQLEQAGAGIRDLFAKLDQGFVRLAGALKPAETAADQISGGMATLATAQAEMARTGEELANVLRAFEQAQQPIADSLMRTSRGFDEATGNFEHLITQLNANQDSVAENLEQVYAKLNQAGDKLAGAADQWGGLVRSGLASTQEFSRQAIEALLAGLEQSPPDFAAVAEAARQSAESAATMSREVTAELQEFRTGLGSIGERLAQLGQAVDQRVGAALATLSGSEIEQLGQAVAGLRQSIGELRQGLGAGSGIVTLAGEIQQLRQTMSGNGPAVRGPWPVVWGVVGLAALLWALLCLGIIAGLIPELGGP